MFLRCTDEQEMMFTVASFGSLFTCCVSFQPHDEDSALLYHLYFAALINSIGPCFPFKPQNTRDGPQCGMDVSHRCNSEAHRAPSRCTVLSAALMGLALLCEALCEIIAAVPERYKRPRLLPRITMTQHIISGTRAQRPGNRSADFYFFGGEVAGRARN